jgi:predicted nucleotidyltransferase
MNKANMLALASYLENIDKERFNLQYWFSEFDFDYDEFDVSYEDIDKSVFLKKGFHSCNTAGCIAGWAAAFVYDDYKNFKESNPERVDISLSEYMEKIYIPQNRVQNYKNYCIDSVSAVDEGRVFLDLKASEASQIFFADKDSLWFKYHEELGLDVDLSDMEAYGYEEHEIGEIFEKELDWSKIHPKQAAVLLRGVVSGEFVFNKTWMDDYND